MKDWTPQTGSAPRHASFSRRVLRAEGLEGLEEMVVRLV